MKQLLSSYSIASGGVVTLTGINRPFESILLISDATTGTVLYSAATGGASSYSQATNSTITLTTAPGLTDKLQIFYDDGKDNAVTLNSTGSLTNYSGTITTGGTAQDIVSAGAISKAFVITNNSANAMYLAIGVTATTGNGIYLPPYGGYEFSFIPTAKLSLYCAVTGAAFAAWGA